ncbi:MAG: MarR family transcriptional regulator [Aeromicrobium sp.]|nr:MarR family transcriptional regulator [Aeromicrobium sp.]
MQPSSPVADVDTAEDAVIQLVLAIGRRFRARLDGDTVDPSQAALLHTLKCRGEMRLGDLADAMRLDASTVSRHVQQLGERGCIDRCADPDDGRALIIRLSDAGAASLRHTYEQRRAYVNEALTGWSRPDREQLRRDLTRLTTSLGEMP